MHLLIAPKAFCHHLKNKEADVAQSGYAFRLLSSPPPIGNPYNVINFIVQYFFIVVAPVFLSGGIYTTLTSLIKMLGQHSSPLGLSRKAIIGVFVSADVVATIVQVAGAALIGLSESNRKSPDTGNHILTAGLAFQVLSVRASFPSVDLEDADL